jgi:hypothetical protein
MQFLQRRFSSTCCVTGFMSAKSRSRVEILAGPQPPLLDRSLFDAVQARLTEQWSHRTISRQKSKALLSGLLFDDAGNKMIVTHATKNRVRYRYYISQPLQRGHSAAPVGSVSRVPANEIEAIVTKALRDRLTSSGHGAPPISDPDAILTWVTKIEIRAKQLAITIKARERLLHQPCGGDQNQDGGTLNDRGEVILAPWIKPPASAPSHRSRPIRAERRAGLIRAVAGGRQWLDEIVSGRMTIKDIAIKQKCSVRQINLTMSMAFLAPPLVCQSSRPSERSALTIMHGVNWFCYIAARFTARSMCHILSLLNRRTGRRIVRIPQAWQITEVGRTIQARLQPSGDRTAKRNNLVKI